MTSLKEDSPALRPCKLKAGLYLVATPIGNLRDITLRALDVLASVDALACEDSRVTKKLLDAYGLDPKLLPYHEHNAAEMRPKIVKMIAAGQAVALVSDAGTPLVSDPGYKLVRDVAGAGGDVISLPGASAVLAALASAGLPTDRFTFAGFLPPKSAARRQAIAELANVPGTLILFEAPQRLSELLNDLAEMMGSREATVARELTKLFEEFRRGSLAELTAHYKSADEPKGEIVVLIGPSSEEKTEDITELLKKELASRSLRDAAAVVAARTGLPKREVYAQAVALSRESK